MIKKFVGSVLRTTKNTQLLSKALASKPVYTFSSVENIEKSRAKLFKAIEREHKFEADNFQEDESIAEFLEERNFKLIDRDDSMFLELVSNQNDTNIRICFQSRQPQDQDPEQEEEVEQQQEEEQEPFQDYCDFTVYIQKSGEQKALAYEVSSFDSEINVHAVTLVEDVEAHKKVGRFERITSEYSGPEFNTLDERLQTSMIEYLKSVGVDEEVAAFVEHVSLDKEQRLYMRWLDQIKSYLQ